METEYHIIIDGVRKIVNRDEPELLKSQANKNKPNIEFDMDWYLSHGYITSSEYKMKHGL